MECPICKQQMEAYKGQKSHDSRNDKTYQRTYYRCTEGCDTWGRLEVPTTTTVTTTEQQPVTA